jgi:hypothetical protein
MAVLVEAISIVIRVDAIRARFPGGWVAFREAVPNGTLCVDDELARVGFMVPDDVKSFIDFLEANGLAYVNDSAARDIVVVDQIRGPSISCDWIDFGHINVDSDPSRRVAACQLRGGTGDARLWTPEGWTWEESLTRQFGFVPAGKEEASLEFLRHEAGLDVYLNKVTGKEVYLGRTTPPNV